MELVQGATPICEGLCRLTSLERQEVWNDCRSCKVRVGSNGNLLWEAFVWLGKKKAKTVFRMRNGLIEVYGYAFWVNQCPSGFHRVNDPVAREDDCGVTKGREDVCEVFQQRGSGAKRKLSRCGRNQMGNEPILALPEGADDFVVYYDARSKDLEACLEKGRSEFDFEAKCHLGKANVDVVPWSEAKNEFEIDVRRSDLDKVQTSIWRDVRTLAIEEAYTTKYSIHPGADTMLCGFRLTNRWLSMKKDIASCGSKYLAYSEEEVEYQGSSGLLLQPETSMVDFRGNWNTHFREMSFSLRWGLSFEYGCASFEAWLWVVEGLTSERCSMFGKKDKLGGAESLSKPEFAWGNVRIRSMSELTWERKESYEYNVFSCLSRSANVLAIISGTKIFSSGNTGDNRVRAVGPTVVYDLNISWFISLVYEIFVIYMFLYVVCGGILKWIINPIERDRLNGIGLCLKFVEFISFTFGDKEMILVI
ncbi:hypothetical protein Tco_0852361 [Tanacetum coccineum]